MNYIFQLEKKYTCILKHRTSFIRFGYRNWQVKRTPFPGGRTTCGCKPMSPGIYSGQCAEYCGSSHALMAFQVVAHEPEEFDSWVAQMTEPPSEPQSQLAQEGQEIFTQSCASCHAVEASEDTVGMQGPNLANYGNRNKMAAAIMENNKENFSRLDYESSRH